MIPHYGYINWAHPDQEMDYQYGDDRHSWQVGDELYIGLKFDGKKEVQQALKYYCMKFHQTYQVVETKPTKYYVKCPNQNQRCPFRMRAILGKNSNKWRVTQWGGPHVCMNPMLSQDHKKMDFEFICSVILGTISIIYDSLCCCYDCYMFMVLILCVRYGD